MDRESTSSFSAWVAEAPGESSHISKGTKEHVSFVTIKLTFETEYKILFFPKLQIKVNIIIHIKHHQATLTSLLIKLPNQFPTPNEKITNTLQKADPKDQQKETEIQIN